MPNVDYRQFTEDLDFLGIDIYPMFVPAADRPSSVACQLDTVRSFAGNFIIPELQSGPGGQGDYFHDNPAPGRMRLLAWQGVARGADGIMHFRWRTCRFGAEQYWCGILDHDNVPRRRYEEACREGEEFARLGGEILGTHLEPEVAVLFDSGLAQMGHFPVTCGLPSPNDLEGHYNVGFTHPEDDLEGIKLLFVPSWAIITPETAVALEKFVERGGTLVITARSGVKNADSHVISQTPPGLLAKLSGCHVEEATAVNEPEETPNSFVLHGVEIRQGRFSEILQPTTGKVLATWTQGHRAGTPAVVENKVGKGICVYIGTMLDTAGAAQLGPHLASLAQVEPLIPELPKEIEVSVRVSEAGKLWFLLNHSDNPVLVSRVPPGKELLSGQEISAGLTIEPFDVAVIKQSG
jgi:beta-galactosidase